MNDEKLRKYLACNGMKYPRPNWSVSELKVIMEEMDFEGEECGYLVFAKSKRGRRYIQFRPPRCYID